MKALPRLLRWRDRPPSPGENLDPARRRARRELARLVLYCLAYLGWLFVWPETELVHWFTLVLVPLAILWCGRRAAPGQAALADTLAALGLTRPRSAAALLPALVVGLGFCALQLLGRDGRELGALLGSPRALTLWPGSLLLMLGTAATTEEFFFRGALQGRLREAFGSEALAVVVGALLFALFHWPYALRNPGWGTTGEVGRSLRAALETGVPVGLALGTVYARSGRCLLAPILTHALVNSLPGMLILERLARGAGP